MTITCHRCQRTVEGDESELGTSGFYRITPGTYWAQFANTGEGVICDACMQGDPRYKAVYGLSQCIVNVPVYMADANRCCCGFTKRDVPVTI